MIKRKAVFDLDRLIRTLLIFLFSTAILSGCSPESAWTGSDFGWTTPSTAPADSSAQFVLSSIPVFHGSPYTEVNNNVPFFTDDEFYTAFSSYEYYSSLDRYGRCQTAIASIGIDLMPTAERGAIGHIRPTGWHTVKYDCVNGKYLYNRCHLIAYQLAGENDNEKNLITGTRYMNTEGMLPFEKTVIRYVERSGNHVLYRVTPVFEAKNPLAAGVLMEALSIEDYGEGICFNVFCYNVQPGVGIDYATGESWLE